MDKKDINFLSEKNSVPKGNPWLLSLKAVPIWFLILLYSQNLQQIAKYFGIDNFFIAAIFILSILLIIFLYSFRKILSASSLIFNAYFKEFSTILILFFYAFYSLRWSFESTNQVFLTGIALILLLIVWKDKILNKIRKKS